MQYLEISFFGFFEPAQIIVGAANIDMGSNVVILNPSSSLDVILGIRLPMERLQVLLQAD